MRNLCTVLMLSLPAGCGVSSKSADVPPSLLVPCDRPVSLPDRALSDREVEVYWGRDRAALVACRSRHEGLAGRGL
ncbi:hypothetical protein CG51_10705 [Haematobacter missouriensis]|nr:hypothetical protein [Haematobacter missouriensis]KFI27241.1 hypothetical protein CG51_10705 [Haematobacter missouriensis]